MSISMNITLPQLGLTIPQAYYRIENVRIEREISTGIDVKFIVKNYVSGYSSDNSGNNLSPIDSQNFQIDLDTLESQPPIPGIPSTFGAKVYGWLMAQDFFQSGVAS
jgi:hypothetical protein